MYSKKNFDIVYNTKAIAQIIPEMAELLDKLEIWKPKIICEIGTYCNGVLACIAKILPGSLMIGIDIGDPENNPEAKDNIEAVPNLHLLSKHDSHDPKTVEDLKKILGDQEIDFLFIDGDHSYKSVKADFEMYSPLVRDGGLIGFHDIKECEEYRKTGVEVHKLWKEIKTKYETQEIKYNNPQEYGGASCGIGLILNFNPKP